MKTVIPKSIPGFTYVESAGTGHEYLLKKNGLRVLLFPKHDIPVAAVMVTYHVGSRNERLGTTGSTHILEHMMFKGSKKFDSAKNNGIGDVIEATGAMINATTWNDRTNYYEIVEARYVKKALLVEADRMRNLLLRKKDLDAEMVVVRNEYERGRNDPMRLLSADVWSTAFINHPYHFDTIGIKEDIEGVSVEELGIFYSEYYWPNNATVTIVGDVEMKEALLLVRDAFGKIPKKPLPRNEIPVEPEQFGERRLILKRVGTVNGIDIGFKIPEGRHPDSAALTVLGAHLTEGKGSVLYRLLVDTNEATTVSSFVSRFYDPGLFEITISLGSAAKHTDVEHSVLKCIAEIQEGSISEEERLRAVEISRTKYLSRLTSYADYAHSLNESLAFGDWKDAERFPTEIKNVTKDDIVRVAKKYLIDDHKTTGHLIAI